MKQTLLELAQYHDFEEGIDYMMYIIESVINGNRKQAYDLYSKMRENDQEDFINNILPLNYENVDDVYKIIIMHQHLEIEKNKEELERKNILPNILFILYSSDLYHTYDSYRVKGVFQNKSMACQYASDQAEEQGNELSDDDKKNLNNIKQTQRNDNNNYIIEEFELNPSMPLQ